MSYKIGTFNILDPNYALKHNQKEGLTSTGQSNWSTRKQGIVKLINGSNLDVICLQEISLDSFNDLKSGLENFYTIKHIKHIGKGDGLAILYKKTFREINSKIESLHGLNFGYVDLQDHVSKKIIRVANCHLLGGPKQDLGKQQIEKLLKAVENDPSTRGVISARIITGDFNADEKLLTETNTKFTSLQQANYQFDGDVTPTEIGKARHLDWIWIRGDAKLSHLNISQPVSVSDHALLATEICLKASKPSSALQQEVSRKNGAPLNNTQSPGQVKHKTKSSTLGKRIKALWSRLIQFFAKLFGFAKKGPKFKPTQG